MSYINNGLRDEDGEAREGYFARNGLLRLRGGAAEERNLPPGHPDNPVTNPPNPPRQPRFAPLPPEAIGAPQPEAIGTVPFGNLDVPDEDDPGPAPAA